jgi:hypothetical protein
MTRTDPDVTTTAVMLSMLRAAALDFDFNWFLAAPKNRLGSGYNVQSGPAASVSKLTFELASPSHDAILKTLSAVVNRK